MGTELPPPNEKSEVSQEIEPRSKVGIVVKSIKFSPLVELKVRFEVPDVVVVVATEETEETEETEGLVIWMVAEVVLELTTMDAAAGA
jgi:hypothetical protein